MDDDDALGIGGLRLGDVLAALVRERPVFHSEADFQHHLVWTAHMMDPLLRVRLETHPLPGLRLDLLLSDPEGDRVAVELKYPTRALRVERDGERFELRNHAGQDLIRYDVVKDVCRLERLVGSGVAAQGWMLLLTNDQGYWTPTTRETVDLAFRLHEGRTLTGRLEWGPSAGSGTTAGREAPLELAGSYQLRWRDYAAPAPGPGGEFRLLAVHVPPRVLSPAPDVDRQERRDVPSPGPTPVPQGGPVPQGETVTTDQTVDRLRRMIEEIRTLRNACEPKSNTNPRYLRYSNAVSALRWITDDIITDEAAAPARDYHHP